MKAWTELAYSRYRERVERQRAEQQAKEEAALLLKRGSVSSNASGTGTPTPNR